MSENNPNESRQPAPVPRVYIDAAQVHVQPYSVHMILGVSDLDGSPAPQIHLTMSPTFAQHLKDALIEALKPRGGQSGGSPSGES